MEFFISRIAYVFGFSLGFSFSAAFLFLLVYEVFKWMLEQ